MALARGLSRPLWTCKSCQTSFIRAFTSTGTYEFPRRQRRWQQLSQYKADDTETLFEPTSTTELPAFEDDVFADRSNLSQSIKSTVTNKNTSVAYSRTNSSKSFRSDGISNLSNKRTSQSLSIPADLVEPEEEVEHFEDSPHDVPEVPERRHNVVRDEPSQKPMSELPWYLQPQHQGPISAELDGSIAERQKLPDLPIHPPQHLESILQHLSVEIGLDYLTILDLRKLDPPPALGNNLMMVIGTARSEKHLNVAAHRFCTWLRREYEFYPFADGLLGRNELKIKQKRKAKKARALANAGAGADSIEALDDGIRTGWVCVHAGHLKPHQDAPLKDVKRINGMIGFGEENNLITLVVQMFTEEKRTVVDLESLWEGILTRTLKKQEHYAAAAHGEIDVNGENSKASQEDEADILTVQEVEAREKFKLGDKTIPDHSHELPSHGVATLARAPA